MAGNYKRKDDMGAYLPTEEEIKQAATEIINSLGYICTSDEEEKQLRKYLDKTPGHRRRKKLKQLSSGRL